MKAHILNDVGGIENLILTEIDRPIPKPNEVLIEVKTVSI